MALTPGIGVVIQFEAANQSFFTSPTVGCMPTGVRCTPTIVKYPPTPVKYAPTPVRRAPTSVTYAPTGKKCIPTGEGVSTAIHSMYNYEGKNIPNLHLHYGDDNV